MGPTPDDLFATPDQHFLAFDGDDALFVRMDRDSYHRSIFLDRRNAARGAQPTRVALMPLVEAARERVVPRTGWIFHVAHCGSTLLARLIDQPRSGLVLREPPPLRQLGVTAVNGEAGKAWDARLRLAAAMAARRYDPALATVVKANVPVNFILPRLLAIDPGAPSILLHFALEPYLLAVLGSPGNRAWIDRVTGLLAPVLASVGLDPSAGTPQRAAALWLAQMRLFDDTLGAFPDAASLDAESFFAAPITVAAAAAAHLGLCPIDAKRSAEQLASYSKEPTRRFDEIDRLARQARRRIALHDDIAASRRWLEASNGIADLPPHLGRPLLGASTKLLS